MASDFVGIAAIIIVIMYIVAYVYHKNHEDSYTGYNSSVSSYTELYHMMKLDDMMHEHHDYTKPTISSQIDVHHHCHDHHDH